MITSDSVFRLLHLSDPHPLPELTLRTELSSVLGGRAIGASELADVLRRLESRRFVTSALNLDNDKLWSLTTEGRTEAASRFR
jgi:DNA-binding PadR family transcriptional regulator